MAGAFILRVGSIHHLSLLSKRDYEFLFIEFNIIARIPPILIPKILTCRAVKFYKTVGLLTFSIRHSLQVILLYRTYEFNRVVILWNLRIVANTWHKSRILCITGR